jgi:hypothetical protein
VRTAAAGESGVRRSTLSATSRHIKATVAQEGNGINSTGKHVQVYQACAQVLADQGLASDQEDFQ